VSRVAFALSIVAVILAGFAEAGAASVCWALRRALAALHEEAPCA
jgi:hypothetical protein